MVVGSGVRRSLSFSNNPNRPSKPRKTYHVRSASLPCRSHPLIFISHLNDAVSELKSWASFASAAAAEPRTSAWLCAGLTRLRSLHESLDDILGLPQTHDSLRRHPAFVEKLLEDFLRFVDVFGIFQTSAMVLKQECSAAQMALRRKDHPNTALHLKALKKSAKEMKKLVISVQTMGSYYSSSSAAIVDTDTELSKAIKDVIEVTVAVCVALFGGISGSFAAQKSSWLGTLNLSKETKKKVKNMEQGIQEFQQIVGVDNLRKKGSNSGDEMTNMGLKRMHKLEDCIGEIESGSERVFRGLMNTRVSLLNILTQ